MHHALRNPAEAVERGRDGKLRGDFAPIVSAHAIGHAEEPALRLHHRRGGWNHVPERVLIGGADAAGVGQFCVLEFKHRGLLRR